MTPEPFFKEYFKLLAREALGVLQLFPANEPAASCLDFPVLSTSVVNLPMFFQ